MEKPEKLIITSTVAPSWIYPDAKNNPRTADDAIAEAISAWKAGAAVIHIHGRQNFTEEEWKRVMKTLRDQTDAVIQIGLSALRIPDRMPVIKMKPDMLSIIANHHDESFPGFKMSLLHDTEELEEYARICTKYGIRPEWEVWHAGSDWNLNYLIGKGLIKAPHFVTLFFDWPGGIWSPATVEELMHRLKQQPPETLSSVSIMSHAQTTVATASVILGHHVRIGTEDNPYYFPGRLAKNAGELVARIVRIASEVGREVAKPDEARKAIGVKNS